MPRSATATNYSVVRIRWSKRGFHSSLITTFTALAIALTGEWAQAQTTVIVPANVEWFDTGIDVKGGVAFLLSISATGDWTNAPGGQSVGGAGYGSLRLPNTIAPTEPFASLIGRVNETIFGIGNSFSKRSPASGRLFLSMNDVPGTFGDNSGQLTVVVTQPLSKGPFTFKDPELFLDLLSADPTPFFERPSFHWVLKNKTRPPISGEFRVLVDGVLAPGDISPAYLLNLGPSSDLSGTLVLFAGVTPYLSAGDHTVTLELRAFTPNHELLAEAHSYLTTFVPSPPPAITIAEFKANPDYQDQGKEVALTWNLQPTSSCVPADLVLKKKDFGEPEVLLLQLPSPTTPGSKSVVVKGTSTPLHYTLGVACKFCVACQTLAATTVTKTIEVGFGPTPPAPTPILVINGPFFTPSDVREKKPFSVSWTFENVGGAQLEEFDVELFLDGVKEGSAKTVPKLDSGKSTNVTWEIAKELLSGSHQLELKRESDGSSLGFRPFSVIP